MTIQLLSASAARPGARRGVRRAPRPSTAAHAHTVQFYDDDAFLAGAVADFLADGMRAGEPVVVIATEAHRSAFAAGLAARGLDVRLAAGGGGCTFLDARETLAAFMAGPLPDPERFRAVVGRVFESCGRGRAPASVRAYGEMVDLLWKDGNAEGALRLEELWNELAGRHRFSLLCAYSMDGFAGSAHAHAFHEVCLRHTHVLPAEAYLEGDDDARLREIALLQQRARALEAEVASRREAERHLRESLAAHARTGAALRESERRLQAALAEREHLLERERAARIEAEEAREAAERASRAKGDFLAVMSHELRTPLNAITGFGELLEVGVYGPLGDEQREAVARIQRSGRHLLGLVDEVLSYAGVESGSSRYDVGDVALGGVLEAAAALVVPDMEARGLRFEHAGCAGAPAARADAEKVRQILLALLANAARFTGRGGSVRLEWAEAGDAVLVRVRDTGQGIPAEKLEAIFEPFVQADASLTREQEGLGLGLAISRELARGMGGDLTVESTPGEGSAFTLALPRGSGPG